MIPELDILEVAEKLVVVVNYRDELSPELYAKLHKLTAVDNVGESDWPLDRATPVSVKQAEKARALWGTPIYLYSEAELCTRAKATLQFKAPYGLTVRYAMKAAPNAWILKLFSSLGLGIDASSGFEARRAIAAGIEPSQISISSQQLPSPTELVELVDVGVKFNACSAAQLDAFGRAFPGHEVGLRVNPGIGSGGTAKTNVGGPASSFGVGL